MLLANYKGDLAQGADGDWDIVNTQHQLKKVLAIQTELKKHHEVWWEAYRDHGSGSRMQVLRDTAD
jgi:hypothetical protein